MNEMWRHRRLAEVTRLARQASGSRFGPKKRDYLGVRGVVETAEVLVEQFSQAGADGGMQASL
eukprot:7578966-Pyramimonas_sp.AAC.1